MVKRKVFLRVLTIFIVLPVLLAGGLIAWSYLTYPSIQIVSGGIDASKQGGDFWTGETGPSSSRLDSPFIRGQKFNGSKQQPFICTTFQYGLGQPVVDNQESIGTPVFPEIFGFPLLMLKPLGYSKTCSIHTRVDYFYFSKTQQQFLPLTDTEARPKDLAVIERDKGELPFIVRVERGTINRFMYSIAMLAPYPESLASPQTLNKQAWNGKLVYKFQGGIGVGHYQGMFSLNKKQALHYDSLKRGFAVAYSTGTRTSTQYNLRLAEETAYMVKQHFENTYGKPQYTVGLGGSGGAIQQYIIAQNHPGLIDAAIPQASFPDMITKTITVADCELLERYFDEEYAQEKTSRWGNWHDRMLVEGSVANLTAVVKKWLRSPAPQPGGSECSAGWRGTVPAVFNPYWTNSAYYKTFELLGFPDEVARNIKWTHWNDLDNIYPVNDRGFAANSWDNVGVQYGLRALKKGELSKQEFLDLNACIGGWKAPEQMTEGAWPWNENADQSIFDPWDKVNMNLSKQCKTGKPAPRTPGDIQSMNIAYNSGHVFTGKITIPVIDIRWYLEPVLNMHHSIASFSSRARIEAATGGRADKHVIWFAECSDLDTVNLKSSCQYEPTGDALDVMDQWMENILAQPEMTVVANKPARAIDSCYEKDGALLYAGNDAWDGVLNDSNAGECTKNFPVYSTSRIQAGGSIEDSLFKCALKPVKLAVKDGTYGPVLFGQQEVTRLQMIFPAGICDYSKPDLGFPPTEDKGV